MAETNENEQGLLSSLIEQRDKLRREISVREEQQALLEETIAKLKQIESGQTVAKGRIISLVKDYVEEHGPSSYEDLLKYVVDHGGVTVAGDIEKRVRQSLSRCLTAGTMVKEGELYKLSPSESDRLSAKD